jgi:ABC-type Fe3+-hydroxamate transport system substrate-binding protein
VSGAVRVVSLVPSVTETLRALGVEPVACTRFCEQPDLPAVGGTKNPDVERILELRPDLVVVNDEENRLEDVERLRAGGVALHDMSPRSVDGVGPAVATLAEAVGAVVPDRFRPDRWDAWLDGLRRARPAAVRRAFVPVWRRPWMSMAGDTYGSSVLALLGWGNVFADAAERYPEVTLEDAAARHPDTVLLPSEPYPFRDTHAGDVQAVLPGARVVLVDGQDLFWWGIRTPGAVERLAAAVAGSAVKAG